MAKTVSLNRVAEMMPASSGQATQVPRILVRAAVSVTDSVNQFHPMMAPTMA